MGNLFFNNEEKKHLKQSIDTLEKENGTIIYSRTYSDEYSSSCDRWDCFVRCDCSDTWK